MSLWKRLFGKRNPGDLTPPPGQPKTPPPSPPAAKPGHQPAAAKDRVVRVFVSSTFCDMVEDRNELMSHVWPALRKVCRGRAVEFVEVDLRWGVTEEQSQRKETLRHCLAEIKRCRPFFIGLLGERYGWVPGPEAYSPALLDEEDWLRNEVAKRSVTELEILHGVLNDPDKATRSFFYFRDPKYALARGGDYMSEDATLAGHQATLKAKVEAVCQEKHIPLRKDYTDPCALAALVLADLTAAIDAEFPPDNVPDVWAREDRDHEAYAKSRRTEFYVGCDAYFDRLDAFAHDGAGGCGMIVLGESGGGKSALLANWIARWRQANPDDFIFQHYIGSSPMSTGHLALMRRLMVAIIRWCGDDSAFGGTEEERIPAQAEEIVNVFPRYLNRLATRVKQQGVRAIIVLDALNQLEDRERSRLLAWLPYRLPDELRLVVSTLPGDTLIALQPRGWPALTIEPLTAEERIRLIACYLAHFSQGLSDMRARKIAGVAAASNPLYLKTLLDDLRAIGAHDQLDTQIADYLQAADIPALLSKILARYERDYERDQPGLVRDTLVLLWAARRGLTEPELLKVLKPTGQERLPAALLSPMLYALDEGLVDRDGVLSFAHEYLRLAVKLRYVSDTKTTKSLRRRLADYFEKRPIDARQADELPWLLKEADERDRLRAYMLHIDSFLKILERDPEELRSYWLWLKEEKSMGKPYVAAFESWAAEPGREVARLSNANKQLVFFLNTAALHNEAEYLCRWGLVFDEKAFGKNHPSVASKLNDLTLLLEVTNRKAEAEPLCRRALAIDERYHGKDHPDVARDLNNLALLLKSTNRMAEAEKLFRRALTIWEKSYGGNHASVGDALNNLSLLLMDTGRSAEAEPLMRRGLSIDEQNLGKDHPSVAIALSSIGVLLHSTYRWDEAEPLFRRALTIYRNSLGESHHFTAMAMYNLAQLLHVTERLEEAEPLMRRAVEIFVDFTRTTGRTHPNLQVSISNYAKVLQNMGLSRDEILVRLPKTAPEGFSTKLTKGHLMINHEAYEQCLILFSLHKYDQCAQKALEIIEGGRAHQSIFQMLLISLQRLGRSEELDDISPKLLKMTNANPWLNSLLRLTLGELEAEELIRMAENRSQLCDGLYYTGARLKTLGLDEEARTKFKECTETGVESIEMVLARMEL